MPRRAVIVLCGIAILALAQTAAAQKFLPKSIQFKGDPEYSDEELMAAAGLKKGVVLTTDEMNASAKRLMNSGVFDQLSYKFDGQDLIFSMSPAELYPIRNENLPIEEGDALIADLHKQFPLFHGKVPAEGTLIDDICGAFEAMLASKGVKANVTAAPYGEKLHSRKVIAVSFSISDVPVRLGEIQIVGASAEMLPKVQTIANRKSDAPFAPVASVGDMVEKATALYEDLGYAAVKVGAVQSGQLVMKVDAIEVPYTLTIQEGRIYKTTAVTIPVGALVTQVDADKALFNKSPAAGGGFRAVLYLIDSTYRSKGYLDLVVTPHPQFDDAAGTVSYLIEIAPGAVYHLGFVKFDNVSDQLRNLLMHYWQTMPGDVFDDSYLESFIAKVQMQDPVLRRSLAGTLQKVETSADPVTHVVDVVIRVEKP